MVARGRRYQELCSPIYLLCGTLLAICEDYRFLYMPLLLCVSLLLHCLW